MQDSWWSHNTDRMILLLLVLILWGTTIAVAVHIFHHDSDSMGAIAFISFMTGSVSTVLGALVLILQGRSTQTGNGNGNPPPIVQAVAPKPAAPATPAPIAVKA